MTTRVGEDLAARVRALLAGLGDGETTRAQRYQLWTAVLGLLHAGGFAGLGGPHGPGADAAGGRGCVRRTRTSNWPSRDSPG
ncbi:hypothetical protein ABT369_50375 [Dactylosporangium sp. NPDC000244]|uniref:hypothetical protein n=1 Tax=Dactylosporangium sp. NPDC000244 TaxID=3154365 RepID=UPI00331BD99A